MFFFFFQAEDGIRDLVRSRGLGDVYKRQGAVFTQAFDHEGRVGGTVYRLHGRDYAQFFEARNLSLIHI